MKECKILIFINTMAIIVIFGKTIIKLTTQNGMYINSEIPSDLQVFAQ